MSPELGVRRKLKSPWITLALIISESIHAESWTIPWRAAKGDLAATIPFEPKELSHYLLSIPEGHLESNADIKNGYTPIRTNVEIIGTFRDRKILSFEQEIEESYYNRYYFVLIEVESERYLPIYVSQYFVGRLTHSSPILTKNEEEFKIQLSVTSNGRPPHTKYYEITSNLKNEPRVEQTD